MHLPAIHQLPQSGHLPFAPGHTLFTAPATRVLVAGRATQVSYRFGSESSSRRMFALHWQVAGRLSQITKHGKALKTIEAKKWGVGVLSQAELNRLALRFALPSREALYRVNLAFRRAGSVLARYGEYFRVVRPTVSVKLVASQASARVGDTLFLRVENYGSTPVRYGEPFSVEGFDGLSWNPSPPDLGPWHLNQFKLFGGRAGACQLFSVPSSMPPGLYRFSKDIAIPPKDIFAEFEVRP